MKNFLFVLLFWIALFWIVVVCIFTPNVKAQIQTSVTVVIGCNNQNFNYSERCNAPVDVNTLELTEDGFEGSLLSGVQFRQSNVVDRLNKMTVEDAFWYIDTKGRFNANSDIQALSIYLTR